MQPNLGAYGTSCGNAGKTTSPKDNRIIHAGFKLLM